MKHPIVICATLGALLFSAGSFAADSDRNNRRDAGERHHREHSRDSDRSHRNERQHRDQRSQRYESHHRREGQHQVRRHHNQHRHGHHQRRNDHSRHSLRHHRRHNNAEYFIGGLILGSLAHPGHHSYRHHTYGNHRISFWMDSFGDCYRIEHRRSGKVYIEVPSYKCY